MKPTIPLRVGGNKTSPQPNNGKQSRTPKPGTGFTPKPGTTTGKESRAAGVTNKENSIDLRNKRIKDALIKMEKALGIRGDSEKGNAVKSNQRIEDFLEEYKLFIKNISKAQREKMLVELQNGLTLLQMVNNYVRYYREVRISFAGFDAQKELAYVLGLFKYDIDDMDFTSIHSDKKQSRRRIRSQQTRHLNTVWTVLNIVDGKSSKPRVSSFAYRFLRLFGVCVMLGDYVTASVLADILLEQMTYESQYRRRSRNNVQ